MLTFAPLHQQQGTFLMQAEGKRGEEACLLLAPGGAGSIWLEPGLGGSLPTTGEGAGEAHREENREEHREETTAESTEQGEFELAAGARGRTARA